MPKSMVGWVGGRLGDEVMVSWGQDKEGTEDWRNLSSAVARARFCVVGFGRCGAECF